MNQAIEPMSHKQDKIVISIMISLLILLGAAAILIGPERINKALVNQENIPMGSMKMREKELTVNLEKHISSKSDNQNWIEDALYNIELSIRDKELQNLRRGISDAS